QDMERGFLLLTDLGNATYIKTLDDGNANALFADATDALIKLQLASRPGVLPEYDAALLRRELDLFPDWYMTRELAHAPDADTRNLFDGVFKTIIASNLSQPQVYVHRDYM